MNWVDELLQLKTVKALPIMTHPGIEKIGKNVRDAVTDGKVHYEAIRYLSEHYPSMACTVIMDLTVEAEAFGSKISMPEDEVPSVTDRLVQDRESVENLKIPGLDAGRFPAYLLANRLAVENIKDKIVLSGCIGPFSLAGRLFGISEIMTELYMDPDTIHILLDKSTQFLIRYCQALKEIGTAGVFMAEPAAGLLSNEDCQAFSSDYVRKVVEAVQDDDFTVILHNCGNTGQCTQAMIDSGARVLHFGNLIDMEEVLNVCPSDVLVMGNLDPVGVFKQGKPQTVRESSLQLLDIAKSHNNFVISSGCDIPPHTPLENIAAFFEACTDQQS
ncbi:MAG: uroporphyrinogen decarboxylase family protein [Bacteroidales bacterium]|jgi:uroporphyrinogen decarboxylase|nr:uroporphyrinogen decarboxylase family protein [Bacteroidales bacterium]MDD2617534.1 uroporphyrinogen decarboxylase family protein [Bacteroidales bacterium]MDD4641059.1 uroporphyrinogen decarboxylase family protein [Bacteroidales bacterium]NLB01871.1 methylcobamide--CoM methyltransferase [Bacteroidales bacterium]